MMIIYYAILLVSVFFIGLTVIDIDIRQREVDLMLKEITKQLSEKKD